MEVIYKRGNFNIHIIINIKIILTENHASNEAKLLQRQAELDGFLILKTDLDKKILEKNVSAKTILEERNKSMFDFVKNSDEISPANIRQFSGISPDFKKKTNYSGNILIPSSSNLVEKKETYEGFSTLSTRME